MKQLSLLLTCLAALTLSSSLLAAEKIMFKWTDADGQVHYTEQAPKGFEYTRIVTHVDASKSQSQPLSNPFEKKEAAAEKKSEYSTWRDENCTIANQNLDILKNASRISADDGQGGKRLMTDEEKAEKIKQMEAQRDKYCKVAENN